MFNTEPQKQQKDTINFTAAEIFISSFFTIVLFHLFAKRNESVFQFYPTKIIYIWNLKKLLDRTMREIGNLCYLEDVMENIQLNDNDKMNLILNILIFCLEW